MRKLLILFAFPYGKGKEAGSGVRRDLRAATFWLSQRPLRLGLQRGNLEPSKNLPSSCFPLIGQGAEGQPNLIATLRPQCSPGT